MRAYLSLRDRPLRQLSRAINHPGDARCDRYYRVVVAATFRQAEQFSILGHLQIRSMTAGAELGIQRLTLGYQLRIQGGDGGNGEPVDGYRIVSW